ncbi:MAG: transporter substrate-binding domain-containing protein [Hyphomicrobiaceae bacterium]|nr:transporter substrate-binding domain-containing protein [Hyphomicrobiaceae bacterium]
MTLDRRRLLEAMAGAATLGVLPLRALAAASPAGTLKVATLKFGSLAWLLDTIAAEKLAEKAGVRIEPFEVATNQAGPIALLADEVDVMVSDWTWAMRQRSLGQALRFRPFSGTLGALMVPKDGAKTLADLEGKRIGVAGSAIDKTWILLRAYSRKELGRDIADITQPVFAAAPLVAEELRNGRIDACLNFWTYAARLEGAGFRPLLTADEMMSKLAIEPPPPLVGFIWKEETERTKAAELKAFFAAVEAGSDVLATSDAAFERLRPAMRATSDAEFFALKAYYRSGIPKPWGAAQTEAAERLFNLLVELGEKELVGGTKFDAKLFDGARDKQ